jgi:hypothetical protein
MLTAATLGMFAYGSYSTIWAVLELVRGPRLEGWAMAGIMLFGLLLVLSAAFVRVRLPGGLALAIGAMLGLQALAVHTSAHFGSGLFPQFVRGTFAAAMVVLAHAGAGSVESPP